LLALWLLGLVAGLTLGWVAYPPSARSSRFDELSLQHQDSYMVMLAAGYAADGDLDGARQRLQRLAGADVPAFLRQRTEAIIRSSTRDIADIRLLVQLAAGLGQLSAPMQPFVRQSQAQ